MARPNRRDLALAEALDQRWTQVASALGQGEVNLAQALVITHALDALPAEKLDAEILARAEAHLVAQAAEFGPRDLRILGRRILDIVAPEIGEQHEAEELAREERAGERKTSLTTKRLGDGTTRITLQPARCHGHEAAHLPGGLHLTRHPTRTCTVRGRPTGSRSTANAVRRSATCSR